MDREPGWEQRYYNSYGNYVGYRFQDFRAACGHRTEDGDCTHPEREGDDCICDLCPCVETDVDGDDTDYSEGEQPVIVVERPDVEAGRVCPRCQNTGVKEIMGSGIASYVECHCKSGIASR